MVVLVDRVQVVRKVDRAVRQAHLVKVTPAVVPLPPLIVVVVVVQVQQAAAVAAVLLVALDHQLIHLGVQLQEQGNFQAVFIITPVEQVDIMAAVLLVALAVAVHILLQERQTQVAVLVEMPT
jgi:hypothetical protein